MTGLEAKILGLAGATSCTVSVGTRGASKGWFANVDGMEVEAGNLNRAVDALIKRVVARNKALLAGLNEDERRISALLATLTAK